MEDQTSLSPRAKKIVLACLALFIAIGMFFSYQNMQLRQKMQLSQAQLWQQNVILPRHAGTWYEGNPEKLQRQLAGYLDSAKPLIDAQHVKKLAGYNAPLTMPMLAVICPHAAYRASGLAAAHSYRAVQQQSIKRIFILAPRHHAKFHGALLPVSDTFATPLGNLGVDKNIVSKLAHHNLFAQDDRPFELEHSLEMQLPFIRQVFGGGVTIVPILIGKLSDEGEIRALGAVVRSCVSRHDLVIASSDFTHYGAKYGYEPFENGSNTRQNITKLDSNAYGYIARADLTGFLQFKKHSKDNICGYLPCAVLLSMLPPDSKVTLLDYYTCDDNLKTLDSRGYSVSYLAIAFSGRSW